VSREFRNELLSESHLWGFIEQSPLTIYIDRLDEASSNVYTSPQLEAILGYSAEEWAEDEDLFLKVIHPDDRDRVLAEHDDTRATGEPFRIEYRMIAKDGRVRWFLDEARIIAEDAAGGPGYHYGYLLDITERKELEEAVRRAEERFRQLVEQLPLAIYIDRIDEQSSNIYTSPQVESMLGYPVDRWVNEPDLFVNVLHPDDHDRVMAEQAEIDKPLRTEYRLIASDGRLVWVRDEAVVMQGEDGEPDRLQGFLVDITERKAAEEALRESQAELSRQKAYYQELHELSPVAILTLDLEERVKSWNPAAEALFGYSQAEAVGQPLDDLLFPTGEMRTESKAVTRKADEGGAHLISRRAHKDGTLVDVEVLMVPLVVAGERTGYLVLYHDISELQRARKEAESAAQAKSAFLATMSHEIRTPMNAVIGMGELLLETDLTDEQRNYAEVIQTSGNALLRIIDDILDFSKIEAGKLELEEHPFDVRECAEGALDLVAVRAAKKSIELACLIDDDVPASISGDPTRLSQALGNLLSNAVKFTEEGEVVLLVSAGERRGHSVRLTFSVRDTGIGIPRERMHRLFESFSQVDASTTRRYGGTGLGLAISKRIAELMGGTVRAESEEGRGSTFHFEVVATEVPEATGRLDAEPRMAGRRVLVVDDNPTTREHIVRRAESWGLEVEAAEHPTEALRRLESGADFDVVIVDMEMSEMGGVALAAKIRGRDEAEHPPLILLAPIDRLAEARSAEGFAEQLTKPVKASQLYEALVRVLLADGPGRSEAAPADTAAPDNAAIRLLVAEDNAVNRQLATAMLGKLGYGADMVTNGREAVAAVAEGAYDVVLMDVQMPELDGLEATREIRDRFPGESGPRIIAMTANAMEGDREACLAAGMDDYVAKPIRIDELARALARGRQPSQAGVERR
jgi:PAS domain S-box-containing protein